MNFYASPIEYKAGKKLISKRMFYFSLPFLTEEHEHLAFRIPYHNENCQVQFLSYLLSQQNQPQNGWAGRRVGADQVKEAASMSRRHTLRSSQVLEAF